MGRVLRSVALAGLGLLLGQGPLCAYQGGSSVVVNHNHTTLAGDGGQLSNLVLGGQAFTYTGATVTIPAGTLFAWDGSTFVIAGSSVGIGTSSPGGLLHVSGGLVKIDGAGGSLNVSSAVAANASVSSLRATTVIFGDATQQISAFNKVVYASSQTLDLIQISGYTSSVASVVQSSLTFTASGNYHGCVLGKICIRTDSVTSAGGVSLMLNGQFVSGFNNGSSGPFGMACRPSVVNQNTECPLVWRSTFTFSAGPITAGFAAFRESGSGSVVNIGCSGSEMGPTIFEECP